MLRRAKRWSILCGLSLVLTSSAVMARQGIVKTKDGATYEGDVVEKSNGVTIVVRGVTTNLTSDQVDSIKYVGDIDQQYKAKLAALPANAGAADHLEIARWLFANKAYDQALLETNKAYQLDPKSQEVTTLEQTIQSQKRLDRMRPAPTVASGTGTTTGGTQPPVAPAGGAGHTATDHKYITADDMNAIRQVEWPRDDRSVQAKVPAEVRKQYLAMAGEKAGAFAGMPPTDQAYTILSSEFKNLRKDIRILNDPAPLVEYRRTIQPMVLKGCAAAACHGGPAGGKFFLYGQPENDLATYTNFYLLTRGGMSVSGAEHLLIDRTYPENSLLAELGLPPDISKVKHPPVNGTAIRAMFKGKDDPAYRALINWMGKSLVLVPAPAGVSFSMDGIPKGK